MMMMTKMMKILMQKKLKWLKNRSKWKIIKRNLVIMMTILMNYHNKKYNHYNLKKPVHQKYKYFQLEDQKGKLKKEF